ncbi:hypothetical protein [Acetobacter persici]|uniref:Uncharacterized protein n=1 Tax=Acetobacter persici TaxID=1076596 RepID=A0A6V8IB22_9PROT|nr:hypothetical protein [Acetobacter persici]GFE94818.1 hypothetical protein DmAi_28770 [Acetobacter persici]
MSAAKKDCISLPSICVQQVMDRIVEQVIASGPQINGLSGLEVGALVTRGMQSVSAAWPKVETAQDLLDIHTKAEAVAALAVWQLIILGAYVNAQTNEMQAADAATKH